MSRRVPCLLVACQVALAPAAAGAERVGVVSPAAGEGERIGGLVTDALAETGRFEVVPPGETAGHLADAAAMGLTCETVDVSCLARVGAFSGLPWLFTWARDDDRDGAVRMILISTRQARVEGAAKGRLGDSEATRAAAVRALVRTAVLDEPLSGQIVVHAEPPDAIARVDGEVRTPGVPHKVEVGRHTVRLEAEGRGAVEAQVEVLPGGAVELRLAAGPDTTVRPTPDAAGGNPLFWSGAATLGLGAVMAAGAGVGALLVAPPAGPRTLPAKAHEERVAAGRALLAASFAGALVGAGGIGMMGVAWALE